MPKKVIRKLFFNEFLIKIIKFNSIQKGAGFLFSKKIDFFSLNYSKKITIHTQKNFFLDFCCRIKDKKVVAVSRENKKIDILDLQKGFLLRSFDIHLGLCRSISFSKDGFTLISGNNSGFILGWDVLSQKLIHSVRLSRFQVSSVYFWPKNNKIYATSGYDGFLRLIDTRFNRKIGLSFYHGCPVENFVFTKKEKMISVGGNFLRLWDFRQKKGEFFIKEDNLISQVHVQGSSIFYSGLNRGIKWFDLEKRKVYFLSRFKKYIISFLPLASIVMIGFSNEIISIANLFFREKICQDYSKNRKPNKRRSLVENFFLPIKDTYNLKKYVYKNSFCMISKTTQFFCLFLNTVNSLDTLDRSNKFGKMFGFFSKNRAILNIFSLFIRILSKENNRKINFKQIETDNFFFMLNLLTKQKKTTRLSFIFWIFGEIAIYFSIIWFFCFRSKLDTCVRMLNDLSGKFIFLYKLRLFRKIRTFVL